MFGWEYDKHAQPHVNREGGCACTLSCCVAPRDGRSLKCICPRCNQECTSIGRLGDPTLILGEVMPVWGRPVKASRWFRR